MTDRDMLQDDSDEVVVECEMEASAETLWHALTEDDLAADWLGARPAAEGREGTSFRIVEAEPYSLLRYAWHDPQFPGAPATVTIELRPLSGGNTWFRLTHREVPETAQRITAANTNGPLALAA